MKLRKAAAIVGVHGYATKFERTLARRDPTWLTNIEWLYARREMGAYPLRKKRGGKWLIFVSNDKVNGVWKKIRKATEAGLLGGESKVRAGRSNPSFTNDQKSTVICVYTYDWRDLDDVARVRYELRKLGFDSPLNYKADLDTRLRRYRVSGSRSIRKYAA